MQMCTITVSALIPAFSIIPYKKTRLRQIILGGEPLCKGVYLLVIVSVSFNKVHHRLFVKDRFGSRLWVGFSCLYFGI